MKTTVFTLACIFAFSVSQAQVQIEGSVYVANGATLYLGSAVTVAGSGTVEVNGSVVFNDAITGDANINLKPTANVTINNGNLTLANEPDENFNNLTLGSNGRLEVKAGNTLLLDGNLANNNAGVGLILNGDNSGTTITNTTYSQLKVVGTQTGTGEVIAELYVKGSAGWKYITSPVNTTFNDLKVASNALVAASMPTGNIFYWDASTSVWKFPTSLTNSFAQGQGYDVYMGLNGSVTYVTPVAGAIDLQGTLFSNADKMVSLGYNTGQATTVTFAGGTSQTATQGWNLIANPYPCTYDWNAETIPTNMFDAIYVWSATNNNYAQYVSAVSVNSGSEFISPFQAFFVQTTANVGSFTFQASHRIVSQDPNFFKTENFNNRMRMVVSSKSNSALSDENYLEFEETATDKFDGVWDARDLINGEGVPNLFYNVNNEHFSINRMALFADSKTVPVSFNCSANGKYVIEPKLDDMDPFWTIELEDLQTGEMYDLRDGKVTFEHNNTNAPNRFLLHINGGDEDYISHANNRVKIYGIQNNVVVKLTGKSSYRRDISVYDLQGRLMATGTIEIGEKEVEIPIQLKDVGVYMVSFESNDMTKAERVFLRP